MLATDAPYSQYFDLDGKPLDAGKIYFGVANQNPETNPVAVYWDAAGTQPAAQPIRTLNGYTMRSGTPALVYTAGDYSVTVRNKKGQRVYYAPSSSAFGNRQQIMSDLADATNAAKGAGLVGYGVSIPYPANTIGWAVQQLISDLANVADPVKGAGLIGFGAGVAYAPGTAGGELQAASVLRRGRAAPHANFGWFTALFTVAECQGPGRALLAQDIADVFQNTFGVFIGGTVSYVRPTGSDANDGSNWGNAFLTLAKALRNTTGGVIYIWPGTYDLSDFRYTDSYGDHPKKIIAPFGGVTLRVAGDDVSAAVWTANGTYGNVWQTTLATANKPIRLLMKNALDRFGEPTPIPQYADLASTNNSTFGWFYDGATKTLYVRFASENVNTTTKTNLQAVYGDAGGDNRTLLYSTTSYWEGITFWGYISVLRVAGQAVPQFWAKNCTFKYSATHAILCEGGYAYHQGCRAHRTAADGANYNLVNGTTSQGLEINFKTEFPGDVDTYGQSQALNPQGNGQNKNGSSNHDSYVVRVNGDHQLAFGPGVADTSPSYSWCLGTTVGLSALAPNVAPSIPRYGILNQGNNAWLDGCSATGNDAGFESDTNANVRTFNCFGTQVAQGGGTFTAYIPT